MKTKLLLTLALAMAFFYACEKNEETVIDLPVEFPLEIGNSWVFQHTIYEPSSKGSLEIDTSFYDTAFVKGMQDGYYLYEPLFADSELYVKNEDSLFVHYGSNGVFYPDPSIMLAYTTLETSTSYFNYIIVGLDSVKIETKKVDFNGKTYNSYIETKYTSGSGFESSRTVTIYNKLGYYTITRFDPENNMEYKTELIKKLENN